MEHSAAVEAVQLDLRTHRERTVEQSHWRARSRAESRLLRTCVDGWLAAAAESRARKLAMQRVVFRLGSMQLTRAWQQWMLAVDESRAERVRAAHGSELVKREAVLDSQRESCVEHLRSRSQRQLTAASLGLWVSYWEARRARELTRLRVLSRMAVTSVMVRNASASAVSARP